MNFDLLACVQINREQAELAHAIFSILRKEAQAILDLVGFLVPTISYILTYGSWVEQWMMSICYFYFGLDCFLRLLRL